MFAILIVSVSRPSSYPTSLSELKTVDSNYFQFFSYLYFLLSFIFILELGTRD